MVLDLTLEMGDVTGMVVNLLLKSLLETRHVMLVAALDVVENSLVSHLLGLQPVQFLSELAESFSDALALFLFFLECGGLLLDLSLQGLDVGGLAGGGGVDPVAGVGRGAGCFVEHDLDEMLGVGVLERGLLDGRDELAGGELCRGDIVIRH